jgi:hypothetical protein
VNMLVCESDGSGDDCCGEQTREETGHGGLQFSGAAGIAQGRMGERSPRLVTEQ